MTHFLIAALIAAFTTTANAAQETGRIIEARALCAQAAVLDQHRRIAANPRADIAALEHFCERLSDDQVLQTDWPCAITKVREGQEVPAARAECPVHKGE